MMRGGWLLGCSVLLLVARGPLSAGDLEPPGPPAPTMVTLQQIYDRVGSVSSAVVGVGRSGQTECWDTQGASIPCAGSGQDGEFQAGTVISPRFDVLGNGAVKDNLTGLVWLANADCFNFKSWADALGAVQTLASGECGLTDGSAAGDWRLPNIRELHSLIEFNTLDPAVPSGHPFTNVRSSQYWSSTTRAFDRTDAFYIGFGDGGINTIDKSDSCHVWPVRGGR